MINIYKGDALSVMDLLIKKGVKVDAVIADIPYGSTACPWDEIIPLQEMWDRLNKIVKDDNTPILLFGQQPFTSKLIMSNVENFKWQWYYKKRIASNFASAKYQPMKHIEDVCVFTRNGKPANYYPIKQKRAESGKKRIQAGYTYNSETPNESMGNLKRNNTDQEYDPDLKNPENIQEFNNRAKGARGLHPTQKPIELMEYLVKSHSKEGDLILDFAMGSGTTGVAAVKLGRRFIGIDKEEKYVEIARERLITLLENLRGKESKVKKTRLHELEKLETDIRYELDNLDFSNEDRIEDSYFYMKSIIDTLQGVDDEEKEDLIHALNFNEDYEEALYDVLLAIEVIKGEAE